MLGSALKEREFGRNVVTVMVGTILAQAIPIAIIPILTRLFTPEDFGLLALYGACASILGVVATARYEIAIMLPKKDDDAKALLQVAITISMCFALLLLSVVFLWGKKIALMLGNSAVEPWLYFLPISVFLTGLYQALTYWNNRQKQFKKTSVSRVSHSLAQGVVQVSLGFFSLVGGLIIGQFAGLFSSVLYLLGRGGFKSITVQQPIKNKLEQMRVYSKFPKYGVFGALCDNAAVQMPVFVLTKFYNGATTGMFSLTFRLLNLPSSIISSAINQVLFQKVVEISHTRPHALRLYIVKLFLLLFVAYLPAVPILFFYGEALFIFIFGEQWSQAGSFAGYLVIAVAVRFAVSPLSAVLGLEQNIKKGVFWQVLYMVTISITLLAATVLPVEEFIMVFVAHEVLLYMIYLCLILQGSQVIK